MGAALPATLALVNRTDVAVGPVVVSPKLNVSIPVWMGRDGTVHHTDPRTERGFAVWLAQQRRDFEDELDRKIEDYRRARDRELGL